MTSITEMFTQGGQTQLHRLHMIRQVIGTTIWVSVGLGLVMLFTFIFWELTLNDLLMLMAYEWSKLVVAYGNGASLFKNVMFPFPEGKQVVPCLWVVQDSSIYRFMVMIRGIISNAFTWGVITSIVSFLAISYGWLWYGRQQRKPKILSGISLASLKVLKKKLKKIGKSEIVLGSLPYPKDFETEHMLIVGTTGSDFIANPSIREKDSYC